MSGTRGHARVAVKPAASRSACCYGPNHPASRLVVSLTYMTLAVNHPAGQAGGFGACRARAGTPGGRGMGDQTRGV